MHADIQACKHVNTRACMHVSMYACEHVCMHEHVHACRARTTQRIKAMQSMAYTILINKKNFQKKWVAKATICMRIPCAKLMIMRRHERSDSPNVHVTHAKTTKLYSKRVRNSIISCACRLTCPIMPWHGTTMQRD